VRFPSLTRARSLCERDRVRRDRRGAGLATATAAACLLAWACGSLQSPTRPDPTPAPAPPQSADPAPNPTPTPVLGLPTPTPTPSPEASPDPNPTPTPPPTDGAGDCGVPLPPELADINVKVHIKGGQGWVIDSTPLVGPDPAYCALIGFTDGRSFCPVRPEGNPQREACELYVTGRAKDTGRPGPTWYFDGSFCTGPAMGCENHPDNQYQAIVYRSGTIEACGKNGVCGELDVVR
jgi:hypothetical protein